MTENNTTQKKSLLQELRIAEWLGNALIGVVTFVVIQAYGMVKENNQMLNTLNVDMHTLSVQVQANDRRLNKIEDRLEENDRRVKEFYEKYNPQKK